MDNPDHRLVAMQARLRVQEKPFERTAAYARLPANQTERAERFFQYMKTTVKKSSWHLLDWSGILRYFRSFVKNETVKKLDPVIMILVLIWLQVINCNSN